MTSGYFTAHHRVATRHIVSHQVGPLADRLRNAGPSAAMHGIQHVSNRAARLYFDAIIWPVPLMHTPVSNGGFHREE